VELLKVSLAGTELTTKYDVSTVVISVVVYVVQSTEGAGAAKMTGNTLNQTTFLKSIMIFANKTFCSH